MDINSLIKAVESLNNNVHIERMEGYLRVKGDVYHARGKLKILGFQWNPKAREWYYLMPVTDLDKSLYQDE